MVVFCAGSPREFDVTKTMIGEMRFQRALAFAIQQVIFRLHRAHERSDIKVAIGRNHFSMA